MYYTKNINIIVNKAKIRLAYLSAMVFLVIVQNLLFSALATNLVQDNGDEHVVYYWWVTILLSPIIETLVFQASVNWVLEMFEFRQINIIAVSAIIFGIVHFRGVSSMIYVFSAIVAGSIFSWMYLHRLKQSNFFQALSDVVFVHGCSNAFMLALLSYK
ncbi:type II CAAX prenyl endopeptidase Rce1 family protein [Undibacterium sp. Ji67W]|uniref:CPBP family glutamic-type intramembrane protease n=1 Tax=Undibacterium sp. Ji67W TaxID=3413042 RepID=UPI003BF0C759